jgi:hypothetical protein
MDIMLNNDVILKRDLIYWIDKEFVQSWAFDLFGREFSDEERNKAIEYIEWGLSASVFDVIDIALKETMSNLLGKD